MDKRAMSGGRSMAPFSVDYRCSDCSAANCKLWRDAGGSVLRCANCAERKTGQKIDEENPDQIGSVATLVAAVPVDDTFWGFASVPEEGVRWWRSLPLRPHHKRPIRAHADGTQLFKILADGLENAVRLRITFKERTVLDVTLTPGVSVELGPLTLKE